MKICPTAKIIPRVGLKFWQILKNKPWKNYQRLKKIAEWPNFYKKYESSFLKVQIIAIIATAGIEVPKNSVWVSVWPDLRSVLIVP